MYSDDLKLLICGSDSVLDVCALILNRANCNFVRSVLLLFPLLS